MPPPAVALDRAVHLARSRSSCGDFAKVVDSGDASLPSSTLPLPRDAWRRSSRTMPAWVITESTTVAVEVCCPLRRNGGAGCTLSWDRRVFSRCGSLLLGRLAPRQCPSGGRGFLTRLSLGPVIDRRSFAAGSVCVALATVCTSLSTSLCDIPRRELPLVFPASGNVSGRPVQLRRPRCVVTDMPPATSARYRWSRRRLRLQGRILLWTDGFPRGRASEPGLHLYSPLVFQ